MPSSRSSCAIAATPSPVCEPITRPVAWCVSPAARTSFASISESGPASTPIFMNPGRMPVPSMPSRASAIHRAAICSALSFHACAGTYLSFTAP
jgi:hypothetical protein